MSGVQTAVAVVLSAMLTLLVPVLVWLVVIFGLIQIVREKKKEERRLEQDSSLQEGSWEVSATLKGGRP